MMELSYDTALCVIPPDHLWEPINRIRGLYDKAYKNWPPHINLIYPFVRPQDTVEALKRIQQHISTERENGHSGYLDVSLGKVGTFTQKNHSTIILEPESETAAIQLSHFRNLMRRALGWESPEDDAFKFHMTVAQSHDDSSASHHFLLEKARLLVPIAWQSSSIVIMIRTEEARSSDSFRIMEIWREVDLISNEARCTTAWNRNATNFILNADTPNHGAQAQPSYQFVPSGEWLKSTITTTASRDLQIPESVIVASYNVLAEFEWPPSCARYPSLISNILSLRASADIIVLQEVTDHFLPFLLAHEGIGLRYPFSTHAPPSQPGVGPLPSLLNIVVLSRYPIEWAYLPFQRRHKGCAIVKFPTLLVNGEGTSSKPFILAACHLSQGLVDGAVAAKKNELKRLLKHMSEEYPQFPWVLAGDFNLTTSSYTLDMARKSGDLTEGGQRYYSQILNLLDAAGLQDAWLTTRTESGESSNTSMSLQTLTEVHEGEQGATFDPLLNSRAAKLVGSGLNNRPQRYDRILVSDSCLLRPSGFNMFGQNPIQSEDDNIACPASDHWGIRCLLSLEHPGKNRTESSNEADRIHMQTASPLLSDTRAMKEALSSHGCLPSLEDERQRNDALRILERLILGAEFCSWENGPPPGTNMVLVPVGSHGLGVWTTLSDVDCLCIGDISPKTFFSIAIQRLRTGKQDGVTILRRVKANTGIMLEIDIRGIKFDLQYCQAPSIIQRWPEAFNRPPTDPIFTLPFQSLTKLKPARDMYYLRRSIPDIAKYRLAHLLIKSWSLAKGLYSAKFGLLGGIHITAMLTPICKALARNEHMTSTADIVVTFFRYYANFQWDRQVVYDAFFHKNLAYRRTFREPLCLLGWHGPALNTAANASVPTVKTIAGEFALASKLLCEGSTPWAQFLDPTYPQVPNDLAGPSVAGFLQSFMSYVKIDARYWGPSPQKQMRFFGWLESRCVTMLVDMNKEVPSLAPRIWPGRFVEEHTQDEEITSTETHACYLIGLAWTLDNSETKGTADEIRATEGALHAVLRNFELRIRRDESFYDAHSCWIAAEVTKKKDIEHLRLDNARGLSIDTFEYDSEDGTDDDDGGMVSADDDDDTNASVTEDAVGKIIRNQPPTDSQPRSAGKLRTAVDVLNRLRWDPTMDASDYMVGYLDRFTGTQERPLDQWKSEQTDEEFIPQHRILYFKRRSDSAIVWERSSRTDKVFGSGLG